MKGGFHTVSSERFCRCSKRKRRGKGRERKGGEGEGGVYIKEA